MTEINNLTAFDIDESFIKKITKEILKKEKSRIEIELSIALVPPKKIKELNKKYLRRNRTTDVLSFPIVESEKIKRDPFRKNNLGEIVICPAKVKENSRKYKADFETEFLRVLIHGVLHLLGYNHERSAQERRKMEKKQSLYLVKFLEV